MSKYVCNLVFPQRYLRIWKCVTTTHHRNQYIFWTLDYDKSFRSSYEMKMEKSTYIFQYMRCGSLTTFWWIKYGTMLVRLSTNIEGISVVTLAALWSLMSLFQTIHIIIITFCPTCALQYRTTRSNAKQP